MVVLEKPSLGHGVYRRVLDKLLRSADIGPEEVFVTYLVKCEPPKGKKPNKSEINACKAWLWRELKLVRPKLVVAFGKGPSSLLQKRKLEIDEVAELDYLPGTKLAAFESFSNIYRGPTQRLYEIIYSLQELKNTTR